MVTYGVKFQNSFTAIWSMIWGSYWSSRCYSTTSPIS